MGAGGGLARAPWQGSLPLGRRVDGLRGESRAPTLRSRSSGLVRRRREPGRLSPADRRRLGVDVVPFLPVSRLPRLPVPRVLGGLLRRRVPRSPRRLLGDRLGGGQVQLPELGLPGPPPHLRRLPLRPRRLDGSVGVSGRRSSRRRRAQGSTSTTRRSAACAPGRNRSPRSGSTTSAARSSSTR